MPDQLPNLDLPLLSPSQAQKHVTHNEALRILDVVTQLTVMSDATVTPPASPEDGTRYLVGAGGQDAWSGQDGQIASYEQGAWVYYTPQPGWRVFVLDTGFLQAFDGTAWHAVGGGLLEDLTGLGLGMDTASAPFSAKVNAALWTALYAADSGSGDLIQTLNKETVGDDAGFVLQTDFATRAILGLFGSDNLRIAVSPDGTNFRDGLEIDSSSGVVDQPNMPRFSGTTNFDNFGAVDTWVKIAINTLDYNDQAIFSAATNLFTAPVNGFYQFGGHLLFKNDSSTAARINTRLLKNGTTPLPGSFGGITGAHVDGVTFINTQAAAVLTAGDTVALEGMFTNASGYFQAGETAFWGYKVG